MWKMAALALLLAGCAAQGPTKAQSEARDINAAVDASLRQARECTDGIERSPEYERLSDRFTLRQPIPMEILADKRKPTEADIPLLLALHRQLATCRARSLQAWSVASPAFVTGAASTYAEGDLDFAKLVRRDISWGEYAEFSTQRSLRFRERYRDAAQRVNSGLNKEHAREMQERQAASRALNDWAAAQRAAAPVFTSCVYQGTVLSCASY